MSLSEPFIKKDSYWADAINSLMLRPPYRAPKSAKSGTYVRVNEETTEGIQRLKASYGITSAEDVVKLAVKHALEAFEKGSNA